MGAKLGYAIEQYNWAICLLNGNGCKKDPEEAVKWFQMAAEKGDKDAQLKLANCLENGIGCKRDVDKALFWYRKSIEGWGWEEAREAIRRLEQK